MNKLLWSFLVTGSLLLAWPVWAVESIERFDAKLYIQRDASVRIVERIHYNFEQAERHGIFRTIPVTYQARGGTYALTISDIAVSDGNGVPRPFTTTTPSRDLEIKIGDANRLVTGPQMYEISYVVDGAFNYFDTAQEFYWNITGNEWPVVINTATATLFLPEGVRVDDTQALCFAGSAGSAQSCLSTTPTTSGDGDWLAYQTNLGIAEGMTVALQVPLGTVYQPTFYQQLRRVVRDNGILALPLITLVGMVALWQNKGRDPKGRGAIPAQYEPPKDLTPAEVGTIVDEKVNQKDISAEIVHLAILGYLKIVRTQETKFFIPTTDYSFVKLREPDNALADFERDLLQRLFATGDTIRLSDLKNSFAHDLQKIRQAIYTRVVDKHYFLKSPRTIQIWYWMLGTILGMLGAVVSIVFFSHLIGLISFVISGLIVGSTGIFMPAKTKQGVLMYEHILGLKRYLSVAEQERLAFHNAPQKNPEHFDALLPYAMVLNVEQQWAAQFKDMHREEPAWYSGGQHFTAAALASDMNSFSSTAGTTLAATASSGGSGFSGGSSGGGFGGGGGGSW